MKKGSVKDYIVYVEDDKAKAMETNGESMKLRDMCFELGLPVLVIGAFENEKNAIDYAEELWRGKEYA